MESSYISFKKYVGKNFDRFFVGIGFKSNHINYYVF